MELESTFATSIWHWEWIHKRVSREVGSSAESKALLVSCRTWKGKKHEADDYLL